jgi:dolichol-phosphate mannosyltransferase
MSSETSTITLSVVIPVYKAENCLNELYLRLKTSLSSICRDYEIVLVEDAGGDRSWEIISDIALHDPCVKGIKLSRNFGQHYAIAAGIDNCKGNWVVIMDCDLQDRPEEIPRLFNQAQQGYDVVLARRQKRKDNIIKKAFSFIFYLILSYLTETKINPQVGSFRILSRKVIDSLTLMRENTRYFGGLVGWLGFPTAYVDVEHAPRFQGSTTYTFPKLINLAIGAILAFSDKPLRLTIKLGFLLSFFSFCYGMYAIVLHIMNPLIQLGWTSLIVSIYFMGGLMVCVVGICGLYIGRIFEEVKQRPLYIIDKKVNYDSKQ